MTLKELRDQETSLRAALKANEAAQNEIIKADFIAQNNGIDIGDTIKFIDSKTECIGIVSKIEVGGIFSYYWINPIKNDGTPSKLQIRLYDKDRETISLIKKAEPKP